MKKYIFLLLIITCVSCKSYRDFLSVETHHIVNASDSIHDGMYVNGEIDGIKTRLLFDTGATRSVLNDIDLIGGKDILNEENHNTLAKARGVEGIKFSLIKYKTKTFSTNLFKSKNKFVLIFDKQIDYFCKKNEIGRDGIIGLDAFYDSETPVFIDYEHGIIKILDSLPNLNLYVEIESIIKKRKILLASEINNKKINLVFDTGNNGYVILSDNPFEERPDVTFESVAFTANNTISFPKHEIYSNKLINVGNLTNSKNFITVIKDYNYAGVGLQFINQYNWIIDFENKKLYAKKVKKYESIEVLKLKNYLNYLSKEINGELIIVFKSDKTNRFQIGAIIKSVDNNIVSEDNICEIQDMLNKEKDWSTFKIETSPRSD